MHTKILALIIIFAFTQSVAAEYTSSKIISESKIRKMDRSLKKHKTHKRNFNTQKEFKQKRFKQTSRHNSYKNGYNYSQANHRDTHRTLRQRGYRHSPRGWVLAYKYDRASFYDSQGYYYGYFNRHGYYFEEVFYRYDRYYTYKDRTKGRGLFDRHYYMPANSDYYGFTVERSRHSGQERGYDRY